MLIQAAPLSIINVKGDAVMYCEILYERKTYFVDYYGFSDDGDLQISIRSEFDLIDEESNLYKEINKVFINQYLSAYVVADILTHQN